MGADDDADCVEHIWRLDTVLAGGRGADTASTCARCGAPRYEPGQAALNDDRPPLA